MITAVVVLGVLAIAGGVAIGWRALHLADERVRLERARADRELAIKERELAIQEQRTAPLTAPDPSTFPRELVTLANGESEEWAREDMQALIAEGYLEAGGDWDRARQYVGARVASQRGSRLPTHLLS